MAAKAIADWQCMFLCLFLNMYAFDKVGMLLVTKITLECGWSSS